MIIKEILEQIEDDTEPIDMIFREKDLQCFKRQCTSKFELLKSLLETKKQLRTRVEQLKKEVCSINPHALDDFELFCLPKVEAEPDEDEKEIKQPIKISKAIKKDHRKRKSPKIIYHN